METINAYHVHLSFGNYMLQNADKYIYRNIGKYIKYLIYLWIIIKIVMCKSLNISKSIITMYFVFIIDRYLFSEIPSVQKVKKKKVGTYYKS